MAALPLKRFEAKCAIDATKGCWLWQGSLDNDGYAHFKVDGKSTLVHRWSYEHFVGPILKGLTIDHLCRVRHCQNPEHLEPVTIGVNTLRGDTLNAMNAAKTHCPKGHEYTIFNKQTGIGRRCKECTYANARSKWSEIKDKMNAYRRKRWQEKAKQQQEATA